MSNGTAGQGNHARVSDPRSWPEHIRERYGVRSRRQRRLAVIGLAFATIAAAIAAQPAWRASREQGVLSMSSFRVIDAQRTAVNFRYQSKSTTFTCAVRAQDTNRADVAFAYLVLRPGASRSWTYTFATRVRASSAEVLGCCAGTSAARLPTPQFPPGVKPPQQPKPGIAPRVDGGFATVRP